jgi:hypothetical protein
MSNQNLAEDHCPLCDLGMSEALTIVSRHRTSTGTVVYARCDCGRLTMWFEAVQVVRMPARLRTTARARAV